MRFCSWLILVLLGGCGVLLDDDDVVGDDDDSAVADDDDDLVGTGDCTRWGPPEVSGDVPCPEPAEGEAWIGDTWQVVVPANSRIDVVVDTVDPASTFDPRVRLIDAIGTFLAAGDDQCECDFSAGPDFGCAEATHPTTFSEPVRIVVAGFLGDACAAERGAYVLRVAVDGVPVEPFLLDDDAPTPF